MRGYTGLCVVAVITACSASATTTTPPPPPPIIPPPPPAPVASLSIAAADSIVFIGETLPVLATAYDSIGHVTIASNVTWTGGNSAVALDADGRTTGLALGSATIVATADGHSASKLIRTAIGATLTDLGGTIGDSNHMSFFVEPSALRGVSRIALVPTPDPGPSVANTAQITIIPGSFVAIAQSPSNAFVNFNNGSTITLPYDPSQLPAGVVPLQLRIVDWSPAVVGLLPAQPLFDSIRHVLTLLSFQRTGDKYGVGYVPSTPPYVISATTAAVTLPRGGSTTVPITIVRNNSSSALSFATSNAPAGLTLSVTPQNTVGTTTTLSLTVASTMAPGVYPITVNTTSPNNRGIRTTVVLTVTDQ